MATASQVGHVAQTGPSSRSLAWASVEGLANYCAHALNEHAERVAPLRGTQDRDAAPADAHAWLERLDALLARADARRSAMTVLSLTHGDARHRAAALECRAKLASLRVKTVSDPVIRGRLKGMSEGFSDLNARVAVRELLAAGSEADGLVLPAARIAELREQVARDTDEFRMNVTSDSSPVLATAAELSGLPADFVQPFIDPESGGAKFLPEFGVNETVLGFADSAKLRERMYLASNSTGYPVNVPVLRRQLVASAALAQAHGAADWPTHALTGNLVGSPGELEDFFARAREVLERRARREAELLLARKRQDHPDATRLEIWDRAYYVRLLRGEIRGVEQVSVRPYLDAEQVRKGMLDFFGQHLDLEFRPVRVDMPWHASVVSYDVVHAGETWTRLHFDTESRAGKLKLAATMNIMGDDMSPQRREWVIMCSFPARDESTGRATLNWEQAELLFHEFGHFLTNVYAARDRFFVQQGVPSGDFGEFPATFNQLWLRDYRVASKVLRHHATGEFIEPEAFATWQRANEFGRSLWAIEALAKSVYAYEVYRRDPTTVDPDGLYRDIFAEMTPFQLPEGVHVPYSFILFPIYRANYYTYFWSEVIAHDVWARVHGDGRSVGEAVRVFRDDFLSRVHTMKSPILLTEFLGHTPSTAPYQSFLAGAGRERTDARVAP